VQKSKNKAKRKKRHNRSAKQEKTVEQTAEIAFADGSHSVSEKVASVLRTINVKFSFATTATSDPFFFLNKPSVLFNYSFTTHNVNLLG
jgi:hypothetical protein